MTTPMEQTLDGSRFAVSKSADALPAALGIAGPRQAVNQFVYHDANDDKDKGDAPVTKATKEFSYWLLICPYPFAKYT